MVCIIDDREDVWNHVPNLIHVKPYRFFQGTADINAPPGLSKTEEDDTPIVHRVRRVSQSSTGSQKDQDSEVKDQLQHASTEQSEKAENEVKGEQTEVEDSKTVKDDIAPEVGGGDATIQSNAEGNEKTEKQQSVDESVEMETDVLERSEVQPVKNEDEAAQNAINDCGGDGDAKEKDHPKEPDKANADINQTEASDTEQEVSDINNKSVEEAAKIADGEGNINKDVPETEDELIEWDDEDDYLFYLEETLKTIHSAFFSFCDQMKERDNHDLPDKEKPSLKNIIPYIRRKVLKGCNIVFSGVIPTNMVAEKSRAYIVAKALGANIQQNVIPKKVDSEKATTHVVAAKLGTTKVRSAQKYKDIQIVNVDWLWCCADRWDRVEEVLFPLTKDTNGNPDSDSANSEKVKINSRDPRKRKKDTSDDSERKDKRRKEEPETVNGNSSEDFIVRDVSEMEIETASSVQKPVEDDLFETTEMTKDEESPVGATRDKKFSLSYNPIYAFSDDDIAYMDKEVDDIMDEEDDPSSEEDEARDARMRQSVLKSFCKDDESSSEESLSGETPRGWGLKKMLSPKSSSSEEEVCSKVNLQQTEDQESDSENVMKRYDDIMTAFAPETESDEYEESIGSVDDEIADAVEKEFLSWMP